MRHLIVIAVAFLTVAPALAQSAATTRLPAPAAAPLDNTVFAMVGRLHSGDWNEAFNILGAPYENNFLIGGGAQHFVLNLPLDLRLGVEGGVALRMGEATSLEGWGGIVARFDGLFWHPVDDFARLAHQPIFAGI